MKNKISKGGHPIQKTNFLSLKLLKELKEMQNPIMLFLAAPPGNPYILSIGPRYINFVEGENE